MTYILAINDFRAGRTIAIKLIRPQRPLLTSVMVTVALGIGIGVFIGIAF